jgi:hypothetical protein
VIHTKLGCFSANFPAKAVGTRTLKVWTFPMPVESSSRPITSTSAVLRMRPVRTWKTYFVPGASARWRSRYTSDTKSSVPGGMPNVRTSSRLPTSRTVAAPRSRSYRVVSVCR